MAGKLVEMIRIDIPGDGRRNAKPVQILPKNARRTGLTISLVNPADRTRPATIYLANRAENLTESTGYPLSSTDADLYLPSCEPLWCINPTNSTVTVRILEEM